MELKRQVDKYYKDKIKNLEAVNWNEEDEMANNFWELATTSFWLPEDFDISRDVSSWNKLTDIEKDTYKKVLAGLTGLDTKQSVEGMSLIAHHEPRTRFAQVYTAFDFYESIHAKSYSHIFTTLLLNKETNYLLNEWVEQEPHLKKKAQYIGYFYEKLEQPNPSTFDRYMAKVASAFLESALFYSGFYYPLLLSGQGVMVQSGTTIYKITQDEAYHGVGVGYTAQLDYQELTEEEQSKADALMYELLEVLYENEVSYSHMLYDKLGLTEDVIRYVQYNFNRALANLGFDDYFNPEPFNPIVNNQTNVDKLSNADFFSTKNDYKRSMNTKDLKDEDFKFDDKESTLVDEFL
ncbi:ribonucleotide reductase of class Ib (aerobic), beta subunit [Staphylococcus phage Twort]|uniref:ribonucleoside-diphosphate reductase n=2 Tax=Staphylococcus phage Twort (strain DSM 17442 / HER 48) TaxID=2908167 RepID=A0A6H0X5D6_BPTWO|nr:ribonucleotide reductase class Ia beta subunit [Staphylococcus phage Twort]AAX92321.1 ORF025 [Staphylococcus phage Twort]QIW89141.1 ribonucleotide reductase of class Ib (aerobic), beta subunit [Staphylococcus phage Twort]